MDNKNVEIIVYSNTIISSMVYFSGTDND